MPACIKIQDNHRHVCVVTVSVGAVTVAFQCAAAAVAFPAGNLVVDLLFSENGEPQASLLGRCLVLFVRGLSPLGK